jgi:hypothetical protein
MKNVSAKAYQFCNLDDAERGEDEAPLDAGADPADAAAAATFSLVGHSPDWTDLKGHRTSPGSGSHHCSCICFIFVVVVVVVVDVVVGNAFALDGMREHFFL